MKGVKGGVDWGKWRGGEDVKLCVGGERARERASEEDRTLADADTLSNVGRAREKLSAWLRGRGSGQEAEQWVKRFE